MSSIIVLGAWLLVDIMRSRILLVALVWSLVMKEPIVCDGSADSLIADLCVCGVWES